MKRLTGIRAPRLGHLMVMLIALPLFISSAREVFLNGQRVSAKAETFSPSEPLPPQGKTIEIDITNKSFQPPNRTPKIPPGLKEQGVRLAVRAGDTIKICNHDKFVAKPFSVSAGNKFEGFGGAAGLRPGSCMSYVVHNLGKDAIRFNLADELRVRNKLFLVVLPVNSPDEGEEDTPPDPRIFGDPRNDYQLSEGGELISDADQAPKKITPPGKPEVEEIPEEAIGGSTGGASGNRQPQTNTKPGVRPCNASEAAAFAKTTGSWKGWRENVTISGSCEQTTGTMVWIEYCEGIDAPYNKNLKRYEGTFNGRMEGGSLQVSWVQPAAGGQPETKGTASCAVGSDGTLNCSSFGCGVSAKKQ